MINDPLNIDLNRVKRQTLVGTYSTSLSLFFLSSHLHLELFLLLFLNLDLTSKQTNLSRCFQVVFQWQLVPPSLAKPEEASPLLPLSPPLPGATRSLLSEEALPVLPSVTNFSDLADSPAMISPLSIPLSTITINPDGHSLELVSRPRRS
jgi:hypothetical protein